MALPLKSEAGGTLLRFPPQPPPLPAPAASDEPDLAEARAEVVDRLLHAWQARLSSSLSPAALADHFGVGEEEIRRGKNVEDLARGKGDDALILRRDAANPGHYVDPASWLSTTPVETGSWWPRWEAWLAEHSSPSLPPPSLGAGERGYPVLTDAPGTYVLAQ